MHAHVINYKRSAHNKERGEVTPSYLLLMQRKANRERTDEREIFTNMFPVYIFRLLNLVIAKRGRKIENEFL